MSLRSPLSRALGLGSAKEGVEHWWWQRVTSVALVPLGLWFIYSVLALLGSDHAAALAWLHSPVQSTLLVLFVASALWHAYLGLQVVIEDYVHSEWLKIGVLVALKLALVLLAVFSVLMIVQISVGG